MKKLSALLVAVVFLLGMSGVSFAADPVTNSTIAPAPKQDAPTPAAKKSKAKKTTKSKKKSKKPVKKTKKTDDTK